MASSHLTNKDCLFFVNLLCSHQAGLVPEPHPCQELSSGSEGRGQKAEGRRRGLESMAKEGQVPLPRSADQDALLGGP